MGCGCGGGSTKREAARERTAKRRTASAGSTASSGNPTRQPGFYWTGPQTRPKPSS